MMKELWTMFFSFARIGGLTFGGGYAMLPMLQREVVEKYHWATEEELTKIPDIGDIIAKSLTSYFNDNHNRGIVEELKELGLNTTYLGQKVVEDESFTGKKMDTEGA